MKNPVPCLKSNPNLFFMNKSILGIVALVAAFFATTGFISKEGREVGTYMPSIEVQSLNDSQKKLNLAKPEQSYLLLNFWNPADAESRLVGKKYQTMLGRNNSGNIRLVAVSTSTDRTLTREVAQLDGRDLTNEFTLSDNLAKTVKNLNLTDGNSAFLIDANGEILAVNPTESDLAAVLQ